MDNGKIFKSESYLYGTTASLTAAADYNATERSMVVTATMTENEARELTGKLVYVQYTKSLTDYVTPMCIERVYPSGTANQTKIVFRWVPGTSVTDEWTTSNTLKIVPTGGGNSVDVHATIVYGTNAFGCVRLGGKGKPNIQMIVKAPGELGSDPLNQRGSVGWKVGFFAAAVLQDDFIVRIEHAVSA